MESIQKSIKSAKTEPPGQMTPFSERYEFLIIQGSLHVPPPGIEPGSKV